MFISEIIKNGVEFRAHATAREAVAYILNTLGPDYTDGPEASFWASDDGERLLQSSGMRDFSAYVNTTRSAVHALADYDDDSKSIVLRALADAIDDGTARGLD